MKRYVFVVGIGLISSSEVFTMDLKKALEEQNKDNSPVRSLAVLIAADQRPTDPTPGQQRSVGRATFMSAQPPQQGLGARIRSFFRGAVLSTTQEQVVTGKRQGPDRDDEDNDLL